MLALSLMVLLQGSIADAPRAATLLAQLDTPPLLSAPPGPALAAPAVPTDVSTARLNYELNVLRRARPGLGGAVTLMSVGAGALLSGGVYLLLSVAVGTTLSLLNPIAVVGIGLMVLGMPLTMIGVWMVVGRVQDRQALDPEIRRLEAELRARRDQQRFDLAPGYRSQAAHGPEGLAFGF